MINHILNIILILTLGLSSTGILVNKHYCKDRLQDYSFFVQVNGCNGAHKLEKKTCKKHIEKPKKSCCHDTSEYFKLDQDQQQEHAELKKIQAPTFISIAVFQNEMAKSINVLFPQYLNYRPPLIAFERSISFQTFLL